MLAQTNKLAQQTSKWWLASKRERRTIEWLHRLPVVLVIIGMTFLAALIATRSTLEPRSPAVSTSHSGTNSAARNGFGTTSAAASIAAATASYYVSVPAENSIRSLRFPVAQIIGNSSDGFMIRSYFRGNEGAAHNKFAIEFLQNFTCSIHYIAFYVVAVNEDGDEYSSAVHPLNVTALGIMRATVDFEFPEFIGWEADTWVYLLIQNLGESGCTNIGLSPSGQATLVLNSFYSTIRQN